MAEWSVRVADEMGIGHAQIVAGDTLEHRVFYDGDAYRIRQLKELGRARGWDIVCEKIGR